MIEIDGSFGEGGGQILRSALALSLLTGKSFRLRNIRANRKPKPGLQPQHLMSVRAAAEVGQAKISGDAVNSKQLTFEPGEVRSGNYRFAIGTAGATGLVLQTVYLPLTLRGVGPSVLTLEGGTHVPKAPCYHFLDVTWRRYLERIGLSVRLEMRRPGFYPRGGGVVVAHIGPCSKVRGLHLTKRTELTAATGFSAVAHLPLHIANRMAQQTASRLGETGIEATVPAEEWIGGPGAVVGIRFDEAPVPTLFFAIGERRKWAEAVADDAANEALAYAASGEPVDPHSADQLVLPLAFAEEGSEYRVSQVTKHLTTNIAVVRMFLERDISCEGSEGSPGVVRISPREL
jgi:RNA 3'-terminal phosphate cyclase (ATP)